MSTTRWSRVEALFTSVRRLPADERERHLQSVVGDDTTVLAEVRSLLAHDAGTDGPLDTEAPGEAFGRELLAETFDGARSGRWVGERIGPWRLGALVGSGGMGEVYAAARDDRAYERAVAVKIMGNRIAGEAARQRFHVERQALAQLDHPGIAHLLDGGTSDDGRPYLVMDLVDGRPLDAWCDDHRLGISSRLGLFLQVCDAVSHAHGKLVVHRDLKPSNVLVTERDGGAAPVVVDFGIAKLMDEEGGDVTVGTQRFFSPEHASPEQIRGEPVTTATDVYSLGVLLHELLTGGRPFDRGTGTGMELAERVCGEEPTRPSTALTRAGGVEAVAHRRRARPDSLRRRLRGDLDAIVLKALRKEPAKRYASVAALAQDVRHHLDGRPVAARKGTWRYRSAKFLRRNRVAVGAVALVAAGVAFHEVRVRQQIEATEEVLLAAPSLFRLMPELRVGSKEKLELQATLDRWSAFAADHAFTDPRRTVDFLEELAQGYGFLGALQDRSSLAHKALEALDSIPDADPLRRARLLVAAERWSEALATLGGHLDGPHPVLVAALVGQSMLHRNAGEIDEALRVVDEAIAMARALPPTDDLKPEKPVVYKAQYLHLLGRCEEAAVLFDEAVTITRALPPAEEHRLALALSQRAMHQHDLARWQAAEADYREAHDLFARTVPPGHPYRLASLSTLGLLHKDMALAGLGDHHFHEAERLLSEGVEAWRRTGDYPDGGVHLLSLAKLRADRLRWSEAEPLVREYLRSLEDRGAERLEFGEAETLLGRILLHLGRVDEAVAVLAVSRAERSAMLAMDQWERHKTTSILGVALAHAGRFEEAEPLVLEGLHHVRRLRGDGHYRTHQAIERAVDLYRRWGRHDDAARWQAELPEGYEPRHLDAL